MKGITKKPQSSVLAAAYGRLLKMAESLWSLWSRTVAPLTGASDELFTTVPVIIIESIFSPVEKT